MAAGKKTVPEIIWEFVSSVKLAVIVILSLAACLATATVLESLYDTPTARYYVYGTGLFYGVLGFLAVNIICSALSRWPWKKSHIPFLLAHVGIVTLLVGAYITARYGLDGNLRVAEGESNAAVEIDTPLLVLTEGGKVNTIPVKWVPPDASFKPIDVRDYGLPYDLIVREFITHADSDFNFVERSGSAKALSPAPQPALHIKLIGGAMRIEQDFWLWAGDPGWAAYAAGPAWLELKRAASVSSIAPAAVAPPGSPTLTFDVAADGALSYAAKSSSGEKVSGRFSSSQLATLGKANASQLTIDPHWRGGVKIEIEKLIRDSWVNTSYKPSRAMYGDMAPPSAVHIFAGKGKDQADVWLGIGTRAVLRASGREIEIGYFRRQVILPFAVHLNRFDVKYYPGSNKPASYSSQVSVEGDSRSPALTQVISMNHPLYRDGIALYQASYEDAMPRPTVSIFSVNHDPGRTAKYAGSLLIVLGTILLFANKYRKRRTAAVTQ
ncbi:MAG: cytochrome c biogenesis protein ResB [Oligoflexia bacterium]|nr:cytochrome c biogenesis protein ResB [Oligoflexia bacterium]